MKEFTAADLIFHYISSLLLFPFFKGNLFISNKLISFFTIMNENLFFPPYFSNIRYPLQLNNF